MPVLQLPDYGKHLIFLGSTGSGKTYLAEKMLQRYARTFAIDTQDSLDIPGNRIRSPDLLAWKLKIHARLHYVPRPEYLDRETWNYVLKTILLSSEKKKPKPRVIYIDEIFHLGFGAVSFPDWLSKSVTTARQRKLSYWISTQRPRMIPGEILTEASKIYVFYLSKAEDIKFISGFSRSDPKQLQEALSLQQDDYSFIEIDNRKGTWQKFQKLKED